MEVFIRKAVVEDSASITKAEQEIALEPGYFCSQPSELNEEMVRTTIQAPKGIYLVAVWKGHIVGHAFLKVLSLQSLQHVAQLNIAVHKGFQRRKIGTLLLQRIIEWAKQSSSIEKIELNVRASNTPAIALYKKMGFGEEGCLKSRVKTSRGYIDDYFNGPSR